MTKSLITINQDLTNELIEQLVKRIKEELSPHILESEWIDSEEAMAKLKCGKSTLATLRVENRIQHSYISPKIILYKTASIQEHINNKIVTYHGK